MMKTMAKTLPGGRGSTSPTSTTSSSSGVSSAASHSLSNTLAGRSSSSKNNSKSCDRIHAIGRNLPGVRRRDKSLDSHVKYRTDAKSSSKGNNSHLILPFIQLTNILMFQAVEVEIGLLLAGLA